MAEGPQTIAEWLDGYVDSHSVYGVEKLGQLEPFGVTYRLSQVRRGSLEVTLHYRNREARLPVERIGDLESVGQRAGNPKGLAPLQPDQDRAELVFAGYWLAGALATLVAGRQPGGMYSGRGFAFRADREAIAEAQSVRCTACGEWLDAAHEC